MQREILCFCVRNWGLSPNSTISSISEPQPSRLWAFLPSSRKCTKNACGGWGVSLWRWNDKVSRIAIKQASSFSVIIAFNKWNWVPIIQTWSSFYTKRPNLTKHNYRNLSIKLLVKKQLSSFFSFFFLSLLKALWQYHSNDCYRPPACSHVVPPSEDGCFLSGRNRTP